MSAAALKALMMLLKKVAVDILSDPEKLLKYILIFVIAFIIIVVVILSPIIFTLSLPTVLFKMDNMSDEIIQEQKEVLELYKNVTIMIEKDNSEWIESQKDRYSWCDDIDVSNNYDLSWRKLLAIDTVRLEQDFNLAKREDIIDIATDFIVRNAYTSTYEDTITRYRKKKDVNGEDVLDENGKPVMEPYTDTVTKDRAHIILYVKDFEDVLDVLDFDEDKKESILNIYDNIIIVDESGNFDNVNWGT